MALTPEEFIQKLTGEKGTRSNEWFLAESLTPWIEEHGEDAFDEFISSLEEDIEVVRGFHSQFLREREES